MLFKVIIVSRQNIHVYFECGTLEKNGAHTKKRMSTKSSSQCANDKIIIHRYLCTSVVSTAKI